MCLQVYHVCNVYHVPTKNMIQTGFSLSVSAYVSGCFHPCSCIIGDTSLCLTKSFWYRAVLDTRMLEYCVIRLGGSASFSESGGLGFVTCPDCIRNGRHCRVRLYPVGIFELRWEWNFYCNQCGFCHLYCT